MSQSDSDILSSDEENQVAQVIPNQNLPPKPRRRQRKPNLWKRNTKKLAKAKGQAYTTSSGVQRVPRNFSIKLCRHRCEFKGQGALAAQRNQTWRTIFDNFNVIGSHERQNEYGKQRQVPVNIISAIRTFLTDLSPRESHYSRVSNPHRLYLESDFTITKLYLMFIQANPNLDPVQHPNSPHAKKWVFNKIFNSEFNIAFGYPRSDVCTHCETLHARKQFAANSGHTNEVEEIENEQLVHWMESRVFYDTISRSKLLDDTHLSICFDFEKNIPIPVTNISEEYFLRQLWIYNFTIHNLKSNQSHSFLYSENFSKKGANEVLSCLKWYLDNAVPNTVKHLHILCDNSTGQNKNRFLFAGLQDSCNRKFKSVTVTFAVPGHSRMPVDRDFAHVEKKKLKTDKLLKPSDWITLIRTSLQTPPVQIVFVNKPLTDNLQDDGTPLVTVLDFKKKLTPILRNETGILEVKYIQFKPNQIPKVRLDYEETAPMSEFKFFKSADSYRTIGQYISSANIAYTDYIPIKKAKLDNVNTLLRSVFLSPGVTFYQSLKSI